jgi:hypothetical protein
MGEGEHLALPLAWEGKRQVPAELHIPAPRRTWMERTFGFDSHPGASRRGTRGDRLAADQIDRLVNASAGWHALHGLPGVTLAGAEHVVLGPCGVIVVHVEDHPRGRVWVSGDSMLVNGEPAPGIRATRDAAAKLAAVLGDAVGYRVPVAAYVVTVGAELRVRQQPHDVEVCTRLELNERLRSRTTLLGPGHVTELYAAARRPETWQALASKQA